MFGEGSSDSEIEDGVCEAIVKKEIKDFLSEPNYFSARTKKKRQRYDDERPSFVSISWSKLIERREVSNPLSRIGKLFRRRFRLPFPLFLKLVEDCQRHRIFPKTRYIPVALKVLACLRILVVPSAMLAYFNAKVLAVLLRGDTLVGDKFTGLLHASIIGEEK